MLTILILISFTDVDTTINIKINKTSIIPLYFL